MLAPLGQGEQLVSVRWRHGFRGWARIV